MLIYVISHVCLAGKPAVLCVRNLKCSKLHANFPPNVLLPDMHIGNIDFYHHILLLVPVTLAEGHKASTKQNPFA